MCCNTLWSCNLQLRDCNHQVRVAAGNEAAEWDIRVLEARQAVTMQASAMAGAYGSLLNVTTDDVLWGMGQVTHQPTLT